MIPKTTSNYQLLKANRPIHQTLSSAGARIILGLPCLLALLFAHSTLAITIPYDDKIGDDVVFQNIEETTGSSPTALYEEPIVVGNELQFDPTDFSAEGSEGGVGITDGQLNFEVCAKENVVLENVTLQESGVFTLIGEGGTIGTFVSVSVPTFITIKEVDGAELIAPFQIQTNMVFQPNGNPPAPFGNYNLISHPGANQPWSGELFVDLTQALIDQSIPFTEGVTKFEVALNNSLTALSEVGTTAEIHKQEFDVIINIPEPATSGLALVFLSVALTAGRRVVR